MTQQAKTVVVGALLTPAGRAAIDEATELVREAGGRVVLVGHVARPRGEDEAGHYLNDLRKREEELERLAEEFRARDVTVAVSVPAAAGTPADAVLGAAAEYEADLIVVGIRRRSRVGKLILGSNSQDILLGAECSVLAVKADEE
ncbi:universal stress protein [Egicoccus halophilus]|uniref:UspA domain-containing protein n=1 Tax=Egicoccus halophilus TaxID=1670830 RepID=A0A8J3ESE1_9ACTN|nr:universal stress protein [Egicoccus halophilus]GGI02421.1 hypothetical protein GCM10011354_00300 [Egicoccus halophilus]